MTSGTGTCGSPRLPSALGSSACNRARPAPMHAINTATATCNLVRSPLQLVLSYGPTTPLLLLRVRATSSSWSLSLATTYPTLLRFASLPRNCRTVRADTDTYLLQL